MSAPVENGLQLVPFAAIGAPTTGTWKTGTLITDALGDLYRCRAGGTPGTWMPVMKGDSVWGAFAPGNPTAVAGLAMRIEWVKEHGSFSAEDEAGIWADESAAFVAVSKEFNSSSVPAPGNAPLVSFFAFANNNNSGGDVVAVLGDAVARTDNDAVWAANFIARNDAGNLNSKLVGIEIDIEPAAGTTCSTESAALLINAFSINIPGPVMLTGGIGGGTFNNGIILGGILDTGAGLAPTSGETMGSLVNSSPGSYTQDAIILGNAHRVRLMGTGGVHGSLYNDLANNVRLVLGSGIMAIRDAGDVNSIVSIDQTGTIDVAGIYKVDGVQVLAGQQTGMGASLASRTAAASYGATERTMLQESHDKIRLLEARMKLHGAVAT